MGRVRRIIVIDQGQTPLIRAALQRVAELTDGPIQEFLAALSPLGAHLDHMSAPSDLGLGSVATSQFNNFTFSLLLSTICLPPAFYC